MTNDELNLKKLVQKRGICKAQLTMFDTYLSGLNTEELTSTDLTNIENRLQKLQPFFDSFNDVQNEIECLSEQIDVNERQLFQDNFFHLTSQASDILIKAKESSIQSRSVQGHENCDDRSCDTSSHVTRRKSTRVKLPTIQLPTFDGSFTLWREFYDSFNALIHTNSELSDVQKLTYLKASLKGEPAGLISSLQTTHENYPIAWALLQKRYDNKRRIVNNHINCMMEMPTMTRESCESLKQIINIQSHVQCLRSLGQPVEAWDAILISIVTSKLDFNTNKEWEAKLSTMEGEAKGKIPSFESLLSFLNNRLSTLEAIKRKPSDIPKQSQNYVRTPRSESKSFHVTSSSCIHCNKDHLIQKCDTFLKLNAEERNKRARELKASHRITL
ncbi:uncharacterized protein LOC116164867 [Photinus pyralis]|nr:uncharacterized protein LOC116164867 [Photinus pyralis]